MRRLPVYLLLDTSGSMRGEPIEAVNTGIRVMCKRRLGPIDFEDFRRVMCLPHRLWTQMET